MNVMPTGRGPSAPILQDPNAPLQRNQATPTAPGAVSDSNPNSPIQPVNTLMRANLGAGGVGNFQASRPFSQIGMPGLKVQLPIAY